MLFLPVIILFSIICLAVAVLAYFAIHLLLSLCAKTGVKSYERLGYRAFGTPGKVSVDLAARIRMYF